MQVLGGAEMHATATDTAEYLAEQPHSSNGPGAGLVFLCHPRTSPMAWRRLRPSNLRCRTKP